MAFDNVVESTASIDYTNRALYFLSHEKRTKPLIELCCIFFIISNFPLMMSKWVIYGLFWSLLLLNGFPFTLVSNVCFKKKQKGAVSGFLLL